jgi:flagellar biosynthesis protein FlhF
MRLEIFRARDLAAVARSAEAILGPDVVVLQSRSVRDAMGTGVEIVAASAADVDAFRAQLTAAPLPAPAERGTGRPYVIALIGPTGAGKTTTIAKLAASAHAFRAWNVGMLTLDTFRVAALEQIATYAEITGCPLEVAYDPDDAVRSLTQLQTMDVVLVDTPGRSPKADARDDDWWPMLRALQPDEIHFVLPAGMRADVAVHARSPRREMQPTHLLFTKLDEVPQDAGTAELAAMLQLPTRWLTDGLDVPADLKPAPQRILTSLGLLAGQVSA